MTVGTLFSPERQNYVNTFDDKLSYMQAYALCNMA